MSEQTALKRDPATGNFLPGTAGGRGRRKGLPRLIDELVGEDARDAFAFLASVMRGEIVSEKLARKPGAHEDILAAAQIPTVYETAPFSVRVQAAELLIKYRHGQAPQSVNVTTSANLTINRIDPSRLDDKKLADLERLLESGEVVDADFKPGEFPLKALPEGTP